MKPEGSNVSYRDLAERFYALDTEVYKASGSELGKVFPGPKHISEKQILKDFLHSLWNVYSEKMNGSRWKKDEFKLLHEL